MRFARLSIFPIMAALAASPVVAQDWPMYLHDAAHSSHHPGEAPFGIALRPVWRMRVGARIASAVTVAGGALYFGDWSGDFNAVRAADGALLWRQYVGRAPDAAHRGLGASSQAVVEGNTVYVAGGDAAVYALDRATGIPVWRVALADPARGIYIWSSLTPYNGALYLGVGDSVARIDLSDPFHPLLRSVAPGGGVWTTPAVDARSNSVDVGGSALAELDGQTLQWIARGAPAGDWASSPALFETPEGVKLAAAAGKNGVLYAVRADDLSPVWQTPLAGPDALVGAPAYDGKRLFVAAGTRARATLFALDPSTGRVLWQRDAGAGIAAPLTVAGGLVYAATSNGLRVFRSETGGSVWDDGGHGPLLTQPVVAGGTIYCTYLEGELVAWRAEPLR